MTTNKDPHRRLLNISVATICKENGFHGVTKASLETFTELLQAHLTELTRSCRNFCEHGHRTTPDLTDVKMALAEVGSSAHAVHVFSKRVSIQPLRPLNVSKPPIEHKSLKTGMGKVSQPSYISNNFPEYPEVHSFVRTPALREPINQYDIVRGRVATQRIATEDSLVKFFSNTNPSDVHIFSNIQADIYPSGNIVTDQYPYLKGLVPSGNNNTTDSEGIDEVETNNESSQNSSQSSNNSVNDNQYLRQPKRLKTKR